MRNATNIDLLIFNEVLRVNNAAFVFYEDKFRQNLKRLQSAFSEFYPEVKLGYSYKTNYTADVCLAAHKESALAEVVSEMEVEMAMTHLSDKSQIIFNGPVKTPSSLEKVILSGGIINIDNQKDIDEISNILNKNTHANANVAFRLNSVYEEDLSRFGQPLEIIKAQIEGLKDNVQWNIIGFHLHLPHRSLESFAFRVQVLIEALNEMNLPNLRYINIGGGFFGTLSPGLKEALGVKNVPSFKDYGELIGRKLKEYVSKRGNGIFPTLYLEPGSSVIADCFKFVSKIHTIKYLNSRNALVSYAGRHLLSPTNKTIKLPCEVINVNRPDDHMGKDETIHYEVVGYTCIESDILGEAEGNSRFDCNNSYIEFSNVGSYSVVMGSNFILPEPPIFKLDAENNIRVLRKKRTTLEVLNQFLS